MDVESAALLFTIVFGVPLWLWLEMELWKGRRARRKRSERELRRRLLYLEELEIAGRVRRAHLLGPPRPISRMPIDDWEHMINDENQSSTTNEHRGPRGDGPRME